MDAIVFANWHGRFLAVSMLLLAVLGLNGCVSKPTVADENQSPRLFEIPPRPAEMVAEAKTDLQSQADSDDRLQFFTAVDASGKPEKKDLSDEFEMTSISMKVISQWDDGVRYWAVIEFTNATKEDVTANLHLYAYDRLGRLIRAEHEANVYFRQGSILTKQYTFTKRGREVRWLIHLTGRRK